MSQSDVEKGSDPAYLLDERRRAALAEIDNASFSQVNLFLIFFPKYLIYFSSRWFHIKVALVAGVGFFTDAYDIFAINIASSMLGYVYNPKQKLSSHQDLGIKVATPVGTLVGQLIFGWLADVVGRKRMCKALIEPGSRALFSFLYRWR